MKTFETALDAITNATNAATIADAAYEEAKKAWGEIEASYAGSRGAPTDLPDTLAGMLRKFGPIAAKYLGGPAAGAAAASFFANEGAFSGLTGIITKVLGGG